ANMKLRLSVAIGDPTHIPHDPEIDDTEYVGLPGQHVVLRTELGGSEARRTYSLTNAPGEWPLRIVARVHEHGRMSQHLARQAKVGDRIDVLPPNGSLTPRAERQVGAQRTFVGFAAGCGITPVLSIVKATLQANPANRFILFYGNSNTERVMCLEELLGLKDRCIDRLALHFVMSREPQEVDLYNGRIDAARVRDLARTLFKPDQVTEFFVCGPGDMIEQVSGALCDLKVPAERIHSEHFRDEEAAHDGAGAATVTAASALAGGASAVDGAATARGSASSGAKAPAATADSGLAQVTVLMNGRHRTFTMKIDGETVLDAATDAGLELPFSCRAGVCSTCRTKVVSGEVAMDQNYALEDWELEQGYVLACQSRCKTPTLELDYDEK
ncbi:MAG: 2Fe-2S iron-sulfur cluster-binding protein, partial [Rickettsia endosymbiont of Ixodes persulcatus]|nr:2Fe-2S iron-sulfur cluster-binding protein [Rickettsia endosymbiont of Ixodes persulcatus]